MHLTYLLAAALAVKTTIAFPNISSPTALEPHNTPVPSDNTTESNSCDCSCKPKPEPGDPLPKLPLADIKFYEEKLVRQTGFVAKCTRGRYEENDNCFFHTRDTYLWGIWKKRRITVVPENVCLHFPFDEGRATICFSSCNETDAPTMAQDRNVTTGNRNYTRLNIVFEKRKWMQVSVKEMYFG